MHLIYGGVSSDVKHSPSIINESNKLQLYDVSAMKVFIR